MMSSGEHMIPDEPKPLEDMVPAAEDTPMDSFQAAAKADCAKENKAASSSDDKNRKKKLPREAREFIIRVAATIAVIWFTLTFLLGVFICHSDNCSPKVMDGDLCITFRPASLSAGDLTVYQHDGETRFGRVAAVAGDRVEISGGVIWVNGYIAGQDSFNASIDGAVRTGAPLTVPNDSVFILNDNLSDAEDSRNYGAIPLSECRGSVVFLMRRRGF